MAPLRDTRKSRRLSHKSPMEGGSSPIDPCQPDLKHFPLLDNVADDEWQAAPAPLQLQQTAPAPSPSECTTTSSALPPSPSVTTHLPFAPRSSHTRNRKEGHIPRPPNPFMVFRSWLWNTNNLKDIEKDNRNVSRIAGRYWNELSEAERAPFRSMAEEAKARHAQLYPEYRYSPGSQKKRKTPQRRSQRTVDIENEKCKKVADQLKLGGVASRDFAREEQGTARSEEKGTPAPVVDQTFSGSLPAPRGEPSLPQTFPAPLIPTSHYPISLPVLPVIEEQPETAHFPGPLARTPELTFPIDGMQGFVVTADAPSLSLNDWMGGDGDGAFSALFPPHLMPGAHSILSGVRPEAVPFVDSCVLGAYTSAVPALLTEPPPFSDFDIDPHSSLAPLGSPVFSDPFDLSTSTAAHSALCALDQSFGPPISPFTSEFFNENLL